MKKIPTTYGAAVVIGILILAISTGCTTTDPQSIVGTTATPGGDSYATVLDTGVLETKLGSYPEGKISAEEESDLRYLQEEEKLARDVYDVLYETWGMQVFKNIGNAEQTHMDSVTVLIDRYGLASSENNQAAGVFEHPELQSLYDSLVKTGIQSPEDALRAAALVEETDIADLRDATARTDNADIRYVYENLMRGSENHLRAFVRNLEQQGESYEPVVLTKDEYSDIISTQVRPGGFS